MNNAQKIKRSSIPKSASEVLLKAFHIPLHHVKCLQKQSERSSKKLIIVMFVYTFQNSHKKTDTSNVSLPSHYSANKLPYFYFLRQRHRSLYESAKAIVIVGH